MNLCLNFFIYYRSLFLDRIVVALFILYYLRCHLFLDVNNLLKIELFKNLLSLFGSPRATKRLILIKFKHDTVIPLILHFNGLDDTVDYVGCSD